MSRHWTRQKEALSAGAAEEDSLTWRVQIGQFAGAGVLWSPPGRCATRFLRLQVLCFFLTAVLVYRTSHFSPCGPSPFSLSARNRRSHPLPPFTFDVTTWANQEQSSNSGSQSLPRVLYQTTSFDQLELRASKNVSHGPTRCSVVLIVFYH